jgi:hypothetical protein
LPEQSLHVRTKKRWAALQSERSSWVTHWTEISNYLLPRSGRFFVSDRNRGGRRHNNIYDNTGTRALRVLAAGMMAGMTSPARPWFRLTLPDYHRDLMQSASVKQWLKDTTDLMLNVFARSNTYRALHSIYEELGAFGTAATVITDNYNSVLHHNTLTAGEYAIATDFNGTVNTLYREFEQRVGAVVTEFGKDNVSTTTRRMFEDGNLDAWVPVVHSIEPRAERDPSKRDAKNMAFKSVYFEPGESQDKVLREGGFRSFTALAPRWATTGGDIYGNSPGMEALGDIKQLQQEQLRKSQGIDYMTQPPLQAPTSMKSRDVDMLPGGVTFVDTAVQNAGIRSAWEVRLDLNHLLADIQDVRERIRGAFYADLFLMLANQQDARMTATEVAERHEEKLLMLGPVLERLHNELLEPLVDQTFEKLIRAGAVPPPPQELQGVELRIEFISMLAQAQRAIGTNSIDRFVGNLGAVAQFKPDVLDKFDQDQWADAYSDLLGIDPELIVPDDKVAMIRQQRAQAQAAAAQAEQMAASAETAAKLGTVQTPDGSNLAQDVISMFSGYTSPQV